MTTGLKMGVATLIVAALTAGAGYWFGKQQSVPHQDTQSKSSALNDGSSTERKILYYRNPMGLPDTSPTPKKDPMGMDYIPVYEGDAPSPGDATPGTVRIDAAKV